MICPAIKAKCQNKPSKAFPLTTETVATVILIQGFDYIKESQAPCSILTHRLLAQLLQHTEGGWLLARDYTLLSNRISRDRGAARLLQNSRCAVLQRGMKKRHWLLLVSVFIHIVPRVPALRWNLNIVMLWEKPMQCWDVMLSALAAPEICAVCSAHQLLALQVERLDFKAFKGQARCKWAW